MKFLSMHSRKLGILALSVLAFQFASGYSLPPATYSPLAKNSSTAKLEELSKGLSTVAKTVSPALVYVSVSKIPQGGSPGYYNPWEFFLNPQQRPQGGQQRRAVRGVGSGFIIDLDRGLIATNNHVIEGADVIGLKLANGETYDANVIGRDPRTDVAVVEIKDKKFNRKGLGYLPLGDSDKLEVGDFVVALGAPFELEASLSFGIVSAVKRDVQLDPYSNLLGSFIQTDAAINPGNSGGPLINMLGQAVGINTAIYSKTGGYDGIGFSVPSNLVRRVIEEILNKGSVSRGYLGVLLQNIDVDLAKDFGLPAGVNGGALITKVEEGSPAEKSGIKTNDVITEVDGRRITSDYQLMSAVGLSSPNQKISLGLYREGKKQNISVTIGIFPSESKLAAMGDPRGRLQQNDRDPSSGGKMDGFGIGVEDLNSASKSKFGIAASRGALVVEVGRNSPADRTGMRPGDLIIGVMSNTQLTEIRSSADFAKASSGKNRILVRLERQGQIFYVELKK